MSAPKQLDAYPFEYYQLIERASREPVTLDLGSDDQARRGGVRLRQMLYTFRKLLQQTGHPHGVLARGMEIRLFQMGGSWLMTIHKSEQSDTSRIIRQALGNPPAEGPASALPPNALPPIPLAPVASEPEPDPVESALRKLGFFTRGDL